MGHLVVVLVDPKGVPKCSQVMKLTHSVPAHDVLPAGSRVDSTAAPEATRVPSALWKQSGRDTFIESFDQTQMRTQETDTFS